MTKASGFNRIDVNERRDRMLLRASALLVALLFFGPLFMGSNNATAETQSGNQSSSTLNTDASPDFTTTFTTVPTSLPGSNSTFSYDSTPTLTGSLGSETMTIDSSTPQVLPPGGDASSGSGGHNGGKLGNAPESHYKVLQKFLQKGKAPPPNYPVPYVIYTKSDGGVEQTTDAFTKQPVMIDVDNNKATGQGGKDIRVKMTIDVNPLVLHMYVELLGSPNPSYLQVTATFPAFFYNGEAGAAGGDPYWTFGYETQPGHGIPPSITMDFTVDKTAGSVHVFKFDWNGVPASPLGFLMGIFQVLDPNAITPNLPAFSNFVASPMPTSANLTFGTTETSTTTGKCMNWASSNPFQLGFTFSEAENIMSTPVSYDTTVNINQVPQVFSICTTEDHAAHTYTVDYTASSNVATLSAVTDLFFGAPSIVHVDLEIDNMPQEMHVVLGDGSLTVGVVSSIGLVRLMATADAGLGDIPMMVNVLLQMTDVPSFVASWSQTSSSNQFSLDTLSPSSCIGSFKFAFANGLLMYPAEDISAPSAHYLFAYSDATPSTAIALRLIGVHHISFAQNNNVGSNTIQTGFCGNNVLYVIAHTTVGSMLTPGHNLDLKVVMDSAPTVLSLSWTDPFVLSLSANQPIASIVSDLTLDSLVAHAEILNIPSDMMWTIDPSGSISFTAVGAIGTIMLQAKEPSGLTGATSFFGGIPIELLTLTLHSVPSFTATWSSDSSTPWTAFSFISPSGFGDLTFALSSSQTGYATHGGIETNRAAFYNDNTLDLGNGLVTEASLWLTAAQVTRAQLGWGGSATTVTAGFGTTTPEDLSFEAQLGGSSPLNPANPRPVDFTVVTSALPTSMDLALTPEQSFAYTASGAIHSITANAEIGTGPSMTTIYGQIFGIPSGANGHWTGNSIHLGLAPSSTLDEIHLQITNLNGLLGTSYKTLDADVTSIPSVVDASWDLATKSAAVSFSDGSFGGGLGQFKLLVTGQDQSPTTAYINSLGGPSSACMTTYSPFTAEIDQRYWIQGQGTNASRQNIVNNIQATYCRDPRLNMASDDYVTYLNSASGNILAARVRQLNSLAATLDSKVGFGEVHFTDGVSLARQFYFRAENSTSNDVILGEVSKLPDGAAPNTVKLTWDVPGNAFSYDFSEVIPFLDLYMGPSDPTGLSSTYTKMVFVDVPATGSLTWDLSSRSSGYFHFVVSSEFEFGIVRQESSGTRYVGFVKMSSLHMTYSIRLPGEGSCTGSYDFCYPLLHINFDLHTSGSPVNGIFGIYERKGGLLSLMPSGPAPTDPDYVPQWTFTLTGFTHFNFTLDWDLGFGISIDWCAAVIPCSIDVNVSLLPTISLSTDLNPWIDFWWNDEVSDSTSVLGITFYYSLNTANYRISDPIDLFPITGLYVDGPTLNVKLSDPSAGVTLQIHGLHLQSDHPDPGL